MVIILHLFHLIVYISYVLHVKKPADGGELGSFYVTMSMDKKKLCDNENLTYSLCWLHVHPYGGFYISLEACRF